MEIFKHLKYYDEIINSEFMDDDKVSVVLVNFYKDYIKNTNINKQKEFKKIIEIDRVLFKYIDDYEFYKLFINTVDDKFILKDEFKNYKNDFFDYMIKFAVDYDDNLKTFITQTRWI